MIDISALYDPIRHRYKGVYRNGKGWQAQVLPIDSDKTRAIGTRSTQEEAARLVATYYLSVFGDNWAEMVGARRAHAWRVRKMVRSSIKTVWLAEVRYAGDWVRVTPVEMGAEPHYQHPCWDAAGQGWYSASAALVAVRLYRHIHHINSASAWLAEQEEAQPSCAPRSRPAG